MAAFPRSVSSSCAFDAVLGVPSELSSQAFARPRAGHEPQGPLAARASLTHCASCASKGAAYQALPRAALAGAAAHTHSLTSVQKPSSGTCGHVSTAPWCSVSHTAVLATHLSTHPSPRPSSLAATPSATGAGSTHPHHHRPVIRSSPLHQSHPPHTCLCFCPRPSLPQLAALDGQGEESLIDADDVLPTAAIGPLPSWGGQGETRRVFKGISSITKSVKAARGAGSSGAPGQGPNRPRAYTANTTSSSSNSSGGSGSGRAAGRRMSSLEFEDNGGSWSDEEELFGRNPRLQTSRSKQAASFNARSARSSTGSSTGSGGGRSKAKKAGTSRGGAPQGGSNGASRGGANGAAKGKSKGKAKAGGSPSADFEIWHIDGARDMAESMSSSGGSEFFQTSAPAGAGPGGPAGAASADPLAGPERRGGGALREQAEEGGAGEGGERFSALGSSWGNGSAVSRAEAEAWDQAGLERSPVGVGAWRGGDGGDGSVGGWVDSGEPFSWEGSPAAHQGLGDPGEDTDAEEGYTNGPLAQMHSDWVSAEEEAEEGEEGEEEGEGEGGGMYSVGAGLFDYKGRVMEAEEEEEEEVEAFVAGGQRYQSPYIPKSPEILTIAKEPVYQVLEVNAEGQILQREVSRRQLVRFSGLTQRDIRRIDPSLWMTNSLPALLVRDNAILLKLGSLRAISTARAVLIFDFNSAGAQSFLDVLLERLRMDADAQTSGGMPVPFELEVVESALISRTQRLESALMDVEPRVLSLLEALPKQLTADTLEELRLCKQALVELGAKAGSLRQMLIELLEQTSDLRRITAIGRHCRVGKDGVLDCSTASEKNLAEDEEQEVEMLLEYYLQRCDSCHGQAEKLLDSAKETEDSLAVNLSSRRLEVSRLELLLQVGTFAVALGALVAGVFGMNLRSRLEENVGAFWFTTFGILAGSFLLFTAMFAYLRQRRIL